MSFHVGQKVVCVSGPERDPPRPELNPLSYWIPNWPQTGAKYTIRGIDREGFEGLLLEEIRNPLRPFAEGHGEARFDPDRFRPIVEKKTDISIFTKMLKRENDRV